MDGPVIVESMISPLKLLVTKSKPITPTIHARELNLEAPAPSFQYHKKLLLVNASPKNKSEVYSHFEIMHWPLWITKLCPIDMPRREFCFQPCASIKDYYSSP